MQIGAGEAIQKKTQCSESRAVYCTDLRAPNRRATYAATRKKRNMTKAIPYHPTISVPVRLRWCREESLTTLNQNLDGSMLNCSNTVAPLLMAHNSAVDHGAVSHTLPDRERHTPRAGRGRCRHQFRRRTVKCRSVKLVRHRRLEQIPMRADRR